MKSHILPKRGSQISSTAWANIVTLRYCVCLAKLYSDFELIKALSVYLYMRFGPRYNTKCFDICTANGDCLSWVESCRYLGVYLCASGYLYARLVMLKNLLIDFSIRYLLN